ncbi:MAG TPA: class I SAM-dependent methyltransferase [Jiangellaceae bacterium]|nr:class I SAM-dependent methyltransferase [Jiangellaceae bacterium]
METSREQAGSATRWGPLFGARAVDWAETWEGPSGWGSPVYEHVLDRAHIDPGSTVLDCGCGAGRFARMAADRGAEVAGIDASGELIEIAAGRTPDGDFRVGDLEALPWDTDSFDLVTGFSSFQFADDKVRALREAGRVSRDLTAAIIPTRIASSGIAAVFKPLFPMFPPAALDGMRRSGMFALSEPGSLDDTLANATLTVVEDDEIEFPIAFDSVDSAARGFVGAGPMALAIRRSGEEAVAAAVRASLRPFTDSDGQVSLPAWYRVVLARASRSDVS